MHSRASGEPTGAASDPGRRVMTGWPTRRPVMDVAGTPLESMTQLTSSSTSFTSIKM
jgi:hypothetical protein